VLALRYDTDRDATANPNGSQADVAGACDETGRVFANAGTSGLPTVQW